MEESYISREFTGDSLEERYMRHIRSPEFPALRMSPIAVSLQTLLGRGRRMARCQAFTIFDQPINLLDK